jgi:hypothetical protein
LRKEHSAKLALQRWILEQFSSTTHLALLLLQLSSLTASRTRFCTQTASPGGDQRATEEWSSEKTPHHSRIHRASGPRQHASISVHTVQVRLDLSGKAAVQVRLVLSGKATPEPETMQIRRAPSLEK